jgi:hypothetical protein
LINTLAAHRCKAIEVHIGLPHIEIIAIGKVRDTPGLVWPGLINHQG